MGDNYHIAGINDNIFFATTRIYRNSTLSMKYIEIFLEALAAEKGRSQKTLSAYSSDLYQAESEIGDLLNASDQDVQNYLSHLPDIP